MAIRDLPYFRFFPKDFLADQHVQMMNDEEIGIYVRMLCLSWVNGPLPKDLGNLSRMLKIPHETLQQAWSALAPCWQGKGQHLRNRRLEAERDYARGRSETNRQNRLRNDRRTKKERSSHEAGNDRPASSESDADSYAESESDAEKKRNPSGSLPASAGQDPKPPKSKSKPKTAKPVTDGHRVRIGVEAEYERVTNGQAMVWGVAYSAQAKALASALGVDETLRRWRIYCEQPHRWESEGSPDFLSFRRNVNRYATTGRRGPDDDRGLSTSEILNFNLDDENGREQGRLMP